MRQPNHVKEQEVMATDLLDKIRGELSEKLQELRGAFDEHERLASALEALEGMTSDRNGSAQAPARRRGRPRSSSATTKPAKATEAQPAASNEAVGKRAPRGANREAVLKFVAKHPDGSTAPEIIDGTGIARMTVYTLLKTLVEKRELAQTGKRRTARYKPSRDAAAATS
jgi:sugar-specific transcriptional regulator TrmB